MNLISSISEKLRPAVEITVEQDKVKGFASAQEIMMQGFDHIQKTMDQLDRKGMISKLRDMSREGAIADKALEKLCEDATSNEVKIDAPKRKRLAIEALLKRTKYQDKRKEFLYLMLRDGDFWGQLEYTESIQPGRLAYITDIVSMPTETMIRNTDKLDKFIPPFSRSFAQVDDISNGLLSEVTEWFGWAKMIHARNDPHKGRYFRYGWSMWASRIKVFNMAMMLLEDSAIMRHMAAQKLRVHYVGKNSTAGTDASLITQYMRNVAQQLKGNTTDLFIDGKHEVEEFGGTRTVMSSVEDIMMILSILSIAVDYPIDLLSGMVSQTSGGEELFRKEVVVKRAIQSIIKKENHQILRPLIDRELFIAGMLGDYRITTVPTSFEDQNKKSKRGLGEIQALVKSPSMFHEENSNDISWEDEIRRLDVDLSKIQELVDKYPDAVKILSRASGFKDPQSGTQGDTDAPEDQRNKLTPGDSGTKEKD